MTTMIIIHKMMIIIKVFTVPHRQVSTNQFPAEVKSHHVETEGEASSKTRRPTAAASWPGALGGCSTRRGTRWRGRGCAGGHRCGAGATRSGTGSSWYGSWYPYTWQYSIALAPPTRPSPAPATPRAIRVSARRTHAAGCSTTLRATRPPASGTPSPPPRSRKGNTLRVLQELPRLRFCSKRNKWLKCSDGHAHVGSKAKKKKSSTGG